MDTRTDPTNARKLVLALQRRLEVETGRAHTLVETHISWVLLGPELAYKLKKPMRLAFLDFSTLALRQRCCEEEVRLNRRLAPLLYLGVAAVHGPLDAPSMEGEGEVLEYAVKMRRFADDADWLSRLTRGDDLRAEVDVLAARIARFHAQAPVAHAGGPYGAPSQVVATVESALQGVTAVFGAAATPVAHRVRAQAGAVEHALAARLAGGHVREGHGDLHVANLMFDADGPTAFDCIEFDPALRWIDVMSDVGFLVMDLQARGHAGLGYRFLNAWLEHSGDYDGLQVLRYYMVYRALVRSQVAALRAAQAGADARLDADAALYLSVAASLAAPASPRLLITHGLPGSGKTWQTQRLLERAGAVRVRSDVERKRLFGLGPLDDSRTQGSTGIYGADATERTYARLESVAATALAAGYPTIVDAAFLRRDERERFRALARQHGCPCSVLHCAEPLEVLRQRVAERAQRRDDASEADAVVLERLHAVQEPLAPDELPDVLEPTPDASTLAAHWLARA